MYNQSRLFGRPGYIPLKEYVADIDFMVQHGPWKVPLRSIDRLHFQILKAVSRFSWFADALHIMHGSNVSPAYAILLSYAQKNGLVDLVGEKGLQHSRGYFSYYLNKKIAVAGREDTMTGQGVAKDRATAFSKALGEMIERVVAGARDMNFEQVTASPQSVISQRIPMVYPPRYHRFLSVQKEKYNGLRHDSSIPIDWLMGKNLITNEQVLIPRKMTSWFIANSQRKNVFVQATTNGSAGYFTKAGAALRGLLEVVQRDAFLVHWLTMIAPQVVRHDTLPEDLRMQVQKLEAYGVLVHILNVTAIPIPSIFIAVTNDKSIEARQVILSGASGLTFHDAIENALREMTIGLEMFYYPEKDSEVGLEKTELEPFVSRLGKLERQLYWRGAEKMAHFEWFISGEQASYHDVCKKYDTIGMKSDRQRLSRCLAILQDLGTDYYPVVYFPKNSVQQEMGFYVAQVFIPKAFPFYLLEYVGTFDSDRLAEFAQSKGVLHWKLNPFPHMFS
ncbi:MAG: YcaO-like family protein [Candidatus Moraniibacteriota bacterium]